MNGSTGGSAAGMFSWDNLRELTELDGHIEFAGELLMRYGWDEQSQPALLRQFRLICEKQRDPKLNLSVIGEFSVGKSSFINALLRSELLQSGALQGTTTVPVWIEDSKRYSLSFRRRQGPMRTGVFDTLTELAAKLAELESAEAGRLESVNVGLPSALLDGQFRLIDTPGTNSLEVWQEKSTAKLLQESSDLSVVLIDATKPLPQTLCRFMSENLGPVLSKCVFVLTKMDAVRPKEREAMKNYVETRLRQEFELESPLVIPYCALQVLDDAAGRPVGDRELLSASYSGEVSLLRHALKCKALAQSRKLLDLVEKMYDAMGARIRELSDGCERELDMLRRSQQLDLVSFAEQQKYERCSGLDSAIAQERTRLGNLCGGECRNAKNEILERLDSYSKDGRALDGLANYVKFGFEKDCMTKSSAIYDSTINSLGGMSSACEREISAFQQKCLELFRGLDVLSVSFNDPLPNPPAPARPSAQKLGDTRKYVGRKLKRENGFFIVFGIIGLIVGTTIMPVIGSILGLVAGFFFGAALSPNARQVGAQAKDKLMAPLNSYFADVQCECLRLTDRHAASMRKRLISEIDRYVLTYRKTVDRRMAEQQAQAAKVSARLNDIRTDMQNIEARRARLSSIGRQLDRLGA